MAGLVPAWPQFLKFLLILILFNLAASSICLFIGIVVKDGGVANLIGSLVMLFSLLFAGLLLNSESIPKQALWLQGVSLPPQNCKPIILINSCSSPSSITH
jgi:ABC-type multidrug transport system permease subunit